MTPKDALRNVELFLFDMDGTLYLGDRLFPFTVELLKTIRARGATYLFMTNNSSKSVQAYVEKLARLGVSANENDFMTSSQATACYLQQHHAKARLYVCGTASLKEELRRAGFVVTDDPAQTDCIVMGFDTELTFKKLEDVCRMLSTRDLPYIATNPDYVCPTEFGSVPDCGSVCDMIFNATEKRPIVIGKPSSLMPELAMKKWGVTSTKTAVIGDRIYTDIKSGINAGTLTVLVMSGETDDTILNASEDRPDLVFSDAGEMLTVLKGEST